MEDKGYAYPDPATRRRAIVGDHWRDLCTCGGPFVAKRCSTVARPILPGTRGVDQARSAGRYAKSAQPHRTDPCGKWHSRVRLGDMDYPHGLANGEGRAMAAPGDEGLPACEDPRPQIRATAREGTYRFGAHPGDPRAGRSMEDVSGQQSAFRCTK